MSQRKNSKRKAAEDLRFHPLFSSQAKKARSDPPLVASGPPTDVDLQGLLDFTDLDDEAAITSRFDAIAKALLHDYVLIISRADGTTTRLQILELEFYLQKAGCHEDPFAHGSEEQKVLGRWYFHRAPRASADSNRSSTSTTEYRGGSRKGVDLTIGRPGLPSDSCALLRGGILLRSIRVLGPKSKVISGPSLLVDQVLALSGATDIPDLVQSKWNGNISAFPSVGQQDPPPSSPSLISLRVVSRGSLGLPSVSTSMIYKSPRIGLELSHPGTTGPTIKPLHSRIQFLPRQYRYFVSPSELVANGRSQTFAGMIWYFSSAYSNLDAALQNMKLIGDICRAMGLKDNTAKKYLGDFKAGRTGGEKLLESFIGTQGKGASSSPASYLKMLGAISQLL